MMMLSRNCPVSLVVGAAGFLGSHLSDRLLEKNVQVIGLDDLSQGRMENLTGASKSKKFHFLHQSAGKVLDLEIPRLDYAFFIISEELDEADFEDCWSNFLNFVTPFKAKIVLVSTIELYGIHAQRLQNLRHAEEKLARISMEEKANARVVRLAAIYGPRMHFRSHDPMVRLIQAAAEENLPQEVVALDFITRSLYVLDAVDLLLKAVMHSATVHKIYDGALLSPVKVAEIKQVLLDPLWHESRNFLPTELPPWPTPNLSKTIKELSWKPRTSLVVGLKETMHYLKEHPVEKKEEKPKVPEKKFWPEKIEESEVKQGSYIRVSKAQVAGIKHYIFLAIVLGFVFYALFYPLGLMFWERYRVPQNLAQTALALGEGNLQQAQKEAGEAEAGVEKMEEVLGLVRLAGESGVLKAPLSEFILTTESLNELTKGTKEGVEGVKDLAEGWEIINGERQGDSKKLLTDAVTLLTNSQKRLSFVSERLQGMDPLNLQSPLLGLQNQLSFLGGWTYLLSQGMAAEGKQNYLLLLLDNTTLRPGGGVALSYARISFDQGKLEEIKVGDISELDDAFKDHLEPPTEVKNDLGQSEWRLKEVATEMNLPSTGRFASWIYQKESGEKVSGVILLDLSALASLLGVLGPVNTSQGEISAGNFWSEMVTSEGKTVMTPVFKETLNRLFFLPQKDWGKLMENTLENFSQKHLSLYFTDTSLQTFIQTKNWGGKVERVSKGEEGEWHDVLALSETETGGTGGNYFLQKGVNLQTSLTQNGEVNHSLIVNYFNQRGGGVLNSYRAKLRVYLPSGSRVTKATLGGEDLTGKMGSFSDLGWAGFSFPLLVQPQEQKDFLLQYEDTERAKFKEEKLTYSLNVYKQPGADKDKFEFKLNLPEGFKALNNGASFKGDLSRDQHLSWTIER
ncbi:MAG: DUF4012 domain-containing protein [bacterium]|nr:DUF4012 domain-containing protein [bacterium]